MEFREAMTPRYQTKGGGHTKVGRPVHMNTGAPEDALRMATIYANAEGHSQKVKLCVTWKTGLPNPIADFSATVKQ
ncbi:hypothetical protein J3P84_16915 [Pseudomonas sp. Z1-29]|uniref:hypothetical protein n=1 Tax=unclassified Pseudomonas TaxID=196821 RepID=UPI003DA7E382